MLVMIEAQIGFLLRALAGTDPNPKEGSATEQRDYNAWLQRRLIGTVWNSGGCSSW